MEVLLSVGTIVMALIISWRDIQTRKVIDYEIAWFSFFTVMPRALEPWLNNEFIMDYGSAVPRLPYWLSQALRLAPALGGAALLLALALPARRITGRTMIGVGDVLFAAAAGFALTAGGSVRMVCLAFFLALPFSLFLFIARRPRKPLPFIPFLALSAFLVRKVPFLSEWFF
ncbi:MAG: hypothetical protein GX850_03175 [Clostridiaceae bacterium]|nr:hypothetical protein [Clostridiaceae bacterium]